MMSSMEEKLLTIAIPTYNGEKTISDMLELLLPQVDDRVEIIISDNCSTDDTYDIINKYIILQKEYGQPMYYFLHYIQLF